MSPHESPKNARIRLGVLLVALVCVSVILFLTLPDKSFAFMLVVGIILPISICSIASFVFGASILENSS